jgi:succinate dehydrogenase / fumarate reductase cytochrome b subunit
MKWLLTYLTSSIGKKQVMGASGCVLVLFMLGHMVGNLQLLIPDPAGAQAAFNTYSHLLTKSKLFLYAVEACLLAIVIIHFYLAITLKLQNYKARGAARYAVDARKGKKQFPTFFMIWTGLAIATFLVWHLLTLRNGIHYFYINPEVADGKVVRDMWLTTVEVLGNPLFAAFYVTTMILLGFHLWHAISSAFQTMGINHHKWTPIIDKVAIVFCVVIALGFATIASGTFAVVNVNEKARAIIEKCKNPEYQEALKTLSERSAEEQKSKAKIISRNPDKAKFMVGKGGPQFEGKARFKGGEKRGFRDGEKFRERRQRGGEGPENAEPQLEEETATEQEGDEL